MGLYDRNYARSGRETWGGRSKWPLSFNATLIAVNIAIFLPMFVAPQSALADVLFRFGFFSTDRTINRLEFWRVLTFQFLHAGFLHLFFNMLGLFIFGPLVESHLGSKRYAAFYLVCGIFGGLTYLLLNGLGALARQMGFDGIPVLIYNSIQTPLVGASAGVFGVIMACAYIAPNTVIQLLIPPVPMRMKVFAYVYVGIAAANLFFGGHNAGGDAAHIGGAVAGYFFIRNVHLLRDFFDVLGDSRKVDRKPRAGPAPAPPRVSPPARPRRAVPDAEVDRILQKVAENGLASLTSSERETLRRATEDQRSVS